MKEKFSENPFKSPHKTPNQSWILPFPYNHDSNSQTEKGKKRVSMQTPVMGDQPYMQTIEQRKAVIKQNSGDQ